MTTLDNDWVCSEGSVDEPRCFALWEYCADCGSSAELDKLFFDRGLFENMSYGGLVPKGTGLPFSEQKGNLWYELRHKLGHLVDICASCSGSGGGYYCGFHELGITKCEQS